MFSNYFTCISGKENTSEFRKLDFSVFTSVCFILEWIYHWYRCAGAVMQTFTKVNIDEVLHQRRLGRRHSEYMKSSKVNFVGNTTYTKVRTKTPFYRITHPVSLHLFMFLCFELMRLKICKKVFPILKITLYVKLLTLQGCMPKYQLTRLLNMNLFFLLRQPFSGRWNIESLDGKYGSGAQSLESIPDYATSHTKAESYDMGYHSSPNEGLTSGPTQHAPVFVLGMHSSNEEVFEGHDDGNLFNRTVNEEVSDDVANFATSV